MKRMLCAMLIIVLLVTSIGSVAVADESGKKQEKRSIAIVFDNSGSMFGNSAWCRATYAMEVFVSMMNQGDEVAIYPMHEITINGAEYSMDDPLILSNPDEAIKIREILSPGMGGTPPKTIDKAYEGLIKMDGERWLIILTDGERFDGYGSDTEKRLAQQLSGYIGSVNIMYLGIGEEAAVPSVTGGEYIYFKDRAKDSAEVLSRLTFMCNMIFGRDTMEIVNGNVDISDLSMRKMIFLVQGKDISDISVTDSSGNEIGRKTAERSMKYSTKHIHQDQNLQGMMVFYENCNAGNYSIRFNGTADSVIAYYEPDVDLVVQLFNDATQTVIRQDEKAFSGSYTLKYGLVDNQTGSLTESKWLGETHYKVEYSINGELKTAECNEKKGELSLVLHGGDVLDAKITADYLSGYHLVKYGPDFGWPQGGFTIVPNEIDATKLVFSISGGKDTYQLSKLEEEGRYFLSASFDGTPLTGDLLRSFEPVLSLEGGNADVRYAPADDGSGYDVFLKYHEDALHTQPGSYILSCNVRYTDVYGMSCTGTNADLPFEIEGETHTLLVDLKAKQTYYQVSKLDVGEPLIAYFAKDGVPLTDEQMAALKIEIDADGVEYYSKMLPGESAIELRLEKSDDLKTGIHRIRISASGTDEIGQTIEGSDSVLIEIQMLPVWTRWAIIAAAIFLLLLLVFLFLNQKVLPKSVKCNGETDFNIGGKTIEDNAKLQYNRSGKTLDLSAPSAPAYPYVSCAAKLKLEAVSPRRTPSAKRRMAVKEVTASSDITSVEVGAAVYELDKTTGKFVKEGSSPTILSNNSVISINGTAQTPNGRKKTAILSQQLRFK